MKRSNHTECGDNNRSHNIMYLPSKAEIRARCLEIQATWDAREEQQRRVAYYRDEAVTVQPAKFGE